MLKKFIGVFTAALLVAGCANGTHDSARDSKQANGEVKLFNGKDTAGWKLVDPTLASHWQVVGDVQLDPTNEKKLASTPGRGVMLQSPEHGTDIYTEREFGDCKVHCEFMIPKGSNSGVYIMGRYEIQILDSFGKPDNELKPNDCGGMYKIVAPKTNAMKAPGEWQTYDIIWRAPRFDASGKKTANAKLVNCTFNGTKIHENVDVPHATPGGIADDEKATGPVLIQGNHGIVAIRNITVTPMDIK